MMKAALHDPRQEELPLSCIAAHAVFPGRTTLTVAEVARTLGMNIRQVIRLIEQAELVAVDISSGPAHKLSSRTRYRIPVSAYDAFIAKRNNLANPAP